MKKILIFSTGYLPGKNYGGPVVSISNFVNLCGDNMDIYIVTSNHDLKDPSPYTQILPGWNQVGKAKVLYCRDEEVNYSNIKKIVSEVNPSIIYQNSFFDAKRTLPLLILSRRINSKLILAPRGELFPNVLKQKAYKKRPYTYIVRKWLIKKNMQFQATNEDEKAQIKKVLGVNSDSIHVLENFPSLPNNSRVKQEKQPGNLNLVYISRIHPQKNLYFALECLRNIEGKVHFDIYGPKEIPQYWENCERLISELPSNITVKYCGIAERDEIHQIYSDSDAMILPTISENYGHSIVEAMLSNCPVIISDNTPWTDMNKFSAGWAISLSRQQEYTSAIQQLVNSDSEEYKEIIKNLDGYLQVKLNLASLKKRYIEVFS